jgi:hypothetical protein
MQSAGVGVVGLDLSRTVVVVRKRTFIVNTDTCDRGGSHWVAFPFPLVEPAEFFDSLGNAPETYHRRFANGPQYYLTIYNAKLYLKIVSSFLDVSV